MLFNSKYGPQFAIRLTPIQAPFKGISLYNEMCLQSTIFLHLALIVRRKIEEVIKVGQFPGGGGGGGGGGVLTQIYGGGFPRQAKFCSLIERLLVHEKRNPNRVGNRQKYTQKKYPSSGNVLKSHPKERVLVMKTGGQ